MGASWALKSATGSTGTGTATISATDYNGSILIALRPVQPWRAKFISMDVGSASWCPGETRTVSVTIKNIGTSTWTDATPEINVAVKWNTDGANWTDYHVRTDANGLAPGNTATYYLTITASNNEGAGYTTPLSSGSNNLTFDLVNEGNCWFGNNDGSCGPGNSIYTSPTLTILTSPAGPTGNASQLFCSSNNPTVADLTATGTGIQWYAAASGGTPLSTSTALSNGTHYYASQTTTCESISRLDVTATLITPPTTANAGPDQTGAATCGLTTVTLAANSPTVGTGAWSIVSGTGGTVTTPSSPTSTFTGTAGSTYTLQWTISNSPCTASTDDVEITFNFSPTTANAGTDESLCNVTSTTLAGNTPSVGTGSWSVVSGIATITTPTSPTSGVTDLVVGTSATLQWTISYAPCTTSTDDVVITVSAPPTTADAGPDQTDVLTCGLTNVTLAANTPAIGTGGWSIVSGTGGTITTPSNPSSTFSGTDGSTYTLRWTITNGSCASSDDVVITFNQNPTISNAGPDQTGATTCGLTTVTLAANSPTVGTGAWSIVSGTGGTVTTPSSPTSTFTGTAGSTYTLQWTISNSPCTASTDDVEITFNFSPTTANAGTDESLCNVTSTTLAGNTPSVGTGSWSVVSGIATITTPTSPTSGVTDLVVGTSATLQWTISYAPCTTSTDDVVITVSAPPTTADAGPDQTDVLTCGLSNVTLAANTPAIGTGLWSIVSGTGGSFSDASSPSSNFNGTEDIAYTLRWTISNAPCTASTDDVLVTFNQNPSTANAGPNKTGAATCGLTTVTLAGNNPTIGTGLWSIVSGTGGSFSNTSLYNSTFSGTAGETYTLAWTVSNSPCNSSTDNVNITFNLPPTTANAGPDQTDALTCGLTNVTLAANTPAIGTGGWSIVSGTGGTITTPSNPSSTFSGTDGSTYTLRWTITNGSCASSDDVVITFNQNPTISNAGPDQTGATTCGLTTVTLAANSPTVGTGAWSIVSGTGGTVTTPSSPTSTFTGTAGSTYTLQWTISNSPCTASTDDVEITFNFSPTTANAGTDESLCNVTSTTLAGNTPSVGTGSWSVVSGIATITTPTSPTSGVTDLVVGTSATLQWTISYAPCTTSTDDVVITVSAPPTTADAGPDQTDVLTCGLSNVTLAANTPAIGTGLWSIVSGTGGSFSDASSPSSNFNGTEDIAYTLRWTISNAPCTASTDDVLVTFNQNPSTANAGPDQTGAATCGLTTVTLAGNNPTIGTGLWSIVSGTGGSFSNTSLYNSTFSGTAGETYTLAWTVSNSPCNSSTDNVNITFNLPPTTANAGPDQTETTTCNLTTVTLAANTPTIGTGAWSIVSGTGGSFDNSANPLSTFTGIAGNSYTLRWTISYPPCTSTTDDAVVTFNVSPVTTGTTICQGESSVMTATCPPGITSSVGPHFPATGANSGTGTAWTNPTRVIANDNSNTTVAVTSGFFNTVTATSQTLKATNFGFTIPSNATIDGVVATIGRYASANSGSNWVKDNNVQLIIAGTATGNNLGLTSTNWPTGETALNYGSSTSNSWGTTLNPTGY